MKILVMAALCLMVVPTYAQKTYGTTGVQTSSIYSIGQTPVNGGQLKGPTHLTLIKVSGTAYKTDIDAPPRTPGSNASVPHGQYLVGKVLSGSVSRAPLTASEVKAMPHACITIGMGRIDGLFWSEAMNRNNTLHLLDLPENAMAKDAPWFHHYCWGKLSKLRSIYAKDPQKRNQEIRIWRNNMEYIVDSNTKLTIKWAYLPEIFTEIAESYLVEKKYALALSMAEKALELNPKHADAYAVIVDSRSAIGHKEKALAAATEGLRYAPTSKGMKRRYKALGGTEPYPEPYIETPEVTAKQSSEPAVEASPRAEPTEPPTQPTSGALPSEGRTTTPPAAPVGSPTNPYCRFCP